MKNDTKLDALIEEATIDCYDDSECLVGFHTCLEDNLKFPFQAKVVGEEVKVTDLDFEDEQIKAICVKKGKKYKINILDIEYDPKAVKNYQWIEAFRKWLGRNLK